MSVAGSAVFAPGGGAKASEFLQSSLNIKPSPLVEEIKSKLCFVSPIAIDSFRQVWNAEGGRPVSLQVFFCQFDVVLTSRRSRTMELQ